MVLQAEGFEVVLAHTLGLYLITGAKVKTDRRDAYSLAKLLLVGVVPAAYIYPVETRPVRDLLRRRSHLVQVRAGEYGSLRRLLLRQGILSSKQQEIKTATEAELEQWFAHPLVRLHASQELQALPRGETPNPERLTEPLFEVRLRDLIGQASPLD